MRQDEPDYLFDRRGPIDLDVARLERTLAVYRHRRRRTWPAALAVAAMIALGIGVAGWWVNQPMAWGAHTASCAGCVWAPGEALDTSQEARASLERRGTLVAAAGTSVRRLPDAEGARLALEQGEIRVELVAPPRWLIVSLPGVSLVDLGCAYTARVDPSGHGAVAVDAGWVALEGSGPASRLPAGTMAATWPDGRTGLPVHHGASDALIAAVDAFDLGRAGPGAVLAAATRAQDALTVWHLVERTEGAQRRAVIDALDALVPGDLPRSDLLSSLDPTALDASLAYVVASTL